MMAITMVIVPTDRLGATVEAADRSTGYEVTV